MSVRILIGDCRERLRDLPDASVDSVVCDPPYHLTSIVKRFGAENAAPAKSNGPTGVYARASRGFMGQTWDGGDVAFQPETWAEVLRVLKPGGHLVAFSGTRTYHRMVVAIEDAGFEIRDQLAWVYGSGFPKSLDVSKAIDKAAGAEREVVGDSPFAARKPNGSAGKNSVGLTATPGAVITAPATEAAKQWQGWGTALKPSWEPICLARKPLSEGSVAANVLRWGCGAVHIDACRISAPCNLCGATDDSTAGISASHTGAQRSHIQNTDRAASSEREPAHRKSPRANGASSVRPDPEPQGSQFCCPACRRSGGEPPRPGGASGQDEAPLHSDVLGLRGPPLAGSDSPSRRSKASANNINIDAARQAARWPSNLCHDGSDEVLAGFPYSEGNSGGIIRDSGKDSVARGKFVPTERCGYGGDGGGSAARYFYCAKATTEERGDGNSHPTVKPIALMRWLVRLVTPKGGTVLDPFMGSGSTGLAADAEQFDFIGIEQSPEYAAIAEKRMRDAAGMFADVKVAA